MKRAATAVFVFSVILSGCGNSVYGPRRLVQTGQFDGDGYYTGSGDRRSWNDRQCKGDGTVTERNAPLDFTAHFYDLACASYRAPSDAEKAQRMMNAGVTLTMIRCNDFFAQRAANQTRSRVVRSAIPPVSALLTGILGLMDFDTVEGQEEAIQILALGQTATVAGLEIFQREFLFDSDNIFAVRRLTMRALDEHSSQILESDAGFYPATRHLIEHQMLCTPASILELVTQAIDDGDINAYSEGVGRERERAFEMDRLRLRVLANELGTDGTLAAEEIGALWVLDSARDKGTAISQTQLSELKTRLARVGDKLFTGDDGQVAVNVPANVQAELSAMSDEIRANLETQATNFLARYSVQGIANAGENPKPFAFSLPDGFANQSARRVEVGVGDQGTD